MLYLELLVQGLIQGSLYAMIAVGLTLVYGMLRILHIAHAGLFTLGGYLAVTVMNATGSLGAAALAAMASAALAGMAIYRLAYQPILDKPPFVALVASIGLYIALEEVFRLVFGPYGLAFAQPPLQTPVAALGLSLKAGELAMAATALIAMAGLYAFANHTRLGTAWRATVDEPQIAESFGVNPVRVRYLVFLIGSALAGLAGLFVAVLSNQVEPTMGAVPSYKALAIIVLGGLGDVRGSLVAALALGVVEAFGTIYLGDVLDRDALAFAFMIAVLMLRPQGLLGGR